MPSIKTHNKKLQRARNQRLNMAESKKTILEKGFNLSKEDFRTKCQENKVLDKKNGSASVKIMR